MKMNWGVGITISIVIFMLISFVFIYIAFNQDVNLVRDDYYEEEVKFNDTIDKVKRTEDLTEKLSIELVKNNIELNFPKDINLNVISGNIYLYRPSDRNKDVKIDIKLDSTNTQFIKTAELIPGLWKIKVEWNSDSISYVNNKILMVQ